MNEEIQGQANPPPHGGEGKVVSVMESSAECKAGECQLLHGDCQQDAQTARQQHFDVQDVQRQCTQNASDSNTTVNVLLGSPSQLDPLSVGTEPPAVEQLANQDENGGPFKKSSLRVDIDAAKKAVDSALAGIEIITRNQEIYRTPPPSTSGPILPGSSHRGGNASSSGGPNSNNALGHPSMSRTNSINANGGIGDASIGSASNRAPSRDSSFNNGRAGNVVGRKMVPHSNSFKGHMGEQHPPPPPPPPPPHPSHSQLAQSPRALLKSTSSGSYGGLPGARFSPALSPMGSMGSNGGSAVVMPDGTVAMLPPGVVVPTVQQQHAFGARLGQHHQIAVGGIGAAQRVAAGPAHLHQHQHHALAMHAAAAAAAGRGVPVHVPIQVTHVPGGAPAGYAFLAPPQTAAAAQQQQQQQQQILQHAAMLVHNAHLSQAQAQTQHLVLMKPGPEPAALAVAQQQQAQAQLLNSMVGGRFQPATATYGGTAHVATAGHPALLRHANSFHGTTQHRTAAAAAAVAGSAGSGSLDDSAFLKPLGSSPSAGAFQHMMGARPAPDGPLSLQGPAPVADPSAPLPPASPLLLPLLVDAFSTKSWGLVQQARQGDVQLAAVLESEHMLLLALCTVLQQRVHSVDLGDGSDPVADVQIIMVAVRRHLLEHASLSPAMPFALRVVAHVVSLLLAAPAVADLHHACFRVLGALSGPDPLLHDLILQLQLQGSLGASGLPHAQDLLLGRTGELVQMAGQALDEVLIVATRNRNLLEGRAGAVSGAAAPEAAAAAGPAAAAQPPASAAPSAEGAGFGTADSSEAADAASAAAARLLSRSISAPSAPGLRQVASEGTAAAAAGNAPASPTKQLLPTAASLGRVVLGGYGTGSGLLAGTGVLGGTLGGSTLGAAVPKHLDLTAELQAVWGSSPKGLSNDLSGDSLLTKPPSPGSFLLGGPNFQPFRSSSGRMKLGGGTPTLEAGSSSGHGMGTGGASSLHGPASSGGSGSGSGFATSLLGPLPTSPLGQQTQLGSQPQSFSSDAFTGSFDLGGLSPRALGQVQQQQQRGGLGSASLIKATPLAPMDEMTPLDKLLGLDLDLGLGLDRLDLDLDNSGSHPQQQGVSPASSLHPTPLSPGAAAAASSPWGPTSLQQAPRW